MGEAYAQVVVDSKERWADALYTYAVPEELRGTLQPGMLVEVPFGARALAGYVLEIDTALPDDLDIERVRPIVRIVEAAPIWGEELLALARWLSSFYQSTWQESLQAVIPGPVLLRLRKLPKPRKTPKRKAKAGGKGEPAYPRPALTEPQTRAVEQLWEAVEQGRTALLHGVTGSGKTEVYLQLAERMLATGRSVVVLVPEVALTPQAIERYRGRLGETVSVMHSALGDGERRASWAALREGTARLALGTRSAVFAPLQNVGLIIVDEEHDNSYKQEMSPRYHARQVASWRCSYGERSAGLVLGSATPCLETYSLARQGRYALVTLTERASGGRLPPVTTVDLKKLRFLKGSVLSPQLLSRLNEVVEQGNQAVLLYNRRGFSPYVQCQDCGEVILCRQCSISLTLHQRARGNRRMVCHYCAFEREVPDCCDKCGGARLLERGAGTEKVEVELSERLPHLRLLRLDRDTTGKIGSHERILEAFGKGEADVLLGTQMVAKGLDFPRVALVGVLSADQGLHFPDFRAPERTFQLLTQVAGRAGRSHVAGEVIVQGFDLDHPCIQFAIRHDYHGFVEHELALRREVGYPPFCRLVRLLMSAERADVLEKYATRLDQRLRQQHGVEVLGPVPCPIELIRGMRRWHFLLKGKQVKDILQKTRNVLLGLPIPAGLRIAIDPDPQSLL